MIYLYFCITIVCWFLLWFDSVFQNVLTELTSNSSVRYVLLNVVYLRISTTKAVNK